MDRKTLFEAVGAAGVIASLVFVGVQVRQSAEATRAATVLQLKDGWADLNLVQMQNPQIMDALVQAVDSGLDSIDPRAQLIVSAWSRTLMHNWSNAYYQYRVGTLDDDQWHALLRDMEGESRYRVVWDVWSRWSHIYDDPFRMLMDSMKAANYDPNVNLPIPGVTAPHPADTAGAASSYSRGRGLPE